MNREEKNDRSVAFPNEVQDGDSKAGSRSPISRVRLIQVIRTRPWLVVMVVLVLLTSAVALTLLLHPGSSGQAGRPVPAPTDVPVPTPSGETGETRSHSGNITISLAPDELENAQIKTEVATTQAVAAGVTGGGPR